jgi:hypothetical protein
LWILGKLLEIILVRFIFLLLKNYSQTSSYLQLEYFGLEFAIFFLELSHLLFGAKQSFENLLLVENLHVFPEDVMLLAK